MPSALLDAPSYESLSTPEFDAAADAALARTIARQAALEATWLPNGHESWGCDQDEGVIRFVRPDGTGIQARVQILGSYHPKTGSWEWAWNNPHVNEALSRDARVVRAHGDAKAYAPLTTGIMQVSAEESRRLIGMAADVVSAEGVHWGEAGPLLVAMTYRDIRAITESEVREAAAAAASAQGAPAEEDDESSSFIGLLLSWLGTSLLSLAFGPYAIHPLVLKRSTPKPAGASYRMLTPVDEARVAPYLLEELAAIETQLSENGFSTLRVTDQVAEEITKLIVLVEQPRERTIGFYFLHASPDSGFTRLMTFQTNFADGVEMYTTNTTTLARTPSRPQADGARFPEITDVTPLYAIHRARVADRTKTVATVALTRAPDPLAYEDRNTREMQSFWVQRGYYRWTSDGRFAMTWRGAALSGWRGLFPWKQITERAHDRKRADVLRRLGL